MKKFISILLIATMLMLLPACSAKPSSASVEPTESADVSPDVIGEDDSSEQSAAEQSDADKATIHAAYKNALTDLCSSYRLPDGHTVDSSDTTCETNYFAICDVDGDGVEELIIEWNAASMAGKELLVYQYAPATAKWTCELTAFPGAVFYSNGAILDGLSHNQGYGYKLWPYVIFEYDASSDTYSEVGSVDSWDKDVMPTGYPDSVDADNAGTVYMINYTGYNSDGFNYSQSEYNAFCNKLLNSASKINLDSRPLTPDNLNF